MGLLTVLKKTKRREKEIRILLLYHQFHFMLIENIVCAFDRGLDNAGKTTLLNRVCHIDDPISPTLGFNIRTVEFSGLLCVMI